MKLIVVLFKSYRVEDCLVSGNHIAYLPIKYAFYRFK